MASEVASTCATGASNRKESAGSSIDVLQVTAMNGKRSHARRFRGRWFWRLAIGLLLCNALAWKSSTDPFTFVAVGMVAGIAQAGDRWGGYGQGAQGYAKRFGATYGEVVIGTFIGGAILPTVLKQDPRYFYKGTGSKKSRLLYALASSVICKGDNGRRQPNYSSVFGNIAAGGISNLYLPSNDRNTAGAIFSAAFIRMGEIAVANVFQEFVVPKLTPNLPTRAPQSGDPPNLLIRQSRIR